MMALAEARAAWQRTANRCLVQEDAKRAPKLAYCSSMPPSITKPPDTEPPTSSDIGQDIPRTASWPLNRPPSDSNLSPSSKWWLQLQPNYGYQKCLIDEPLFMDGSINESSACENKDKEEFKSFYNQKVKEDIGETRDDEVLVGCGVSKSENELYFDSEKSNTPWWRTADTEELAFLVSQSSHEIIENCDLPRPQNTRLKNDIFLAHGFKQGRLLAVGGDCPKFRMSGEGQLISEADKRSRDYDLSEERMHKFEEDTTKDQLLEALRHSQTRAREAETAAKQACVEKEHVLKLVFRQASQLFAYKQWLQLLQLENMYFQLKNNKSTVFPVILPWTPQRTKKTRKSWHKSYSRRRAKRSCSGYDVGKYAVIFALGLGLVGAGLLLGWTIGWMLPTL